MSTTKPKPRSKPAPSVNPTEALRAQSQAFALASSPTRLTILAALASGELSAGEIREAVGSTSRIAVSHQLSLLRHGRLIQDRRDGRKIIYSLTDAGRRMMEAVEGIG